jgi:hypothetical protein
MHCQYNKYIKLCIINNLIYIYKNGMNLISSMAGIGCLNRNILYKIPIIFESYMIYEYFYIFFIYKFRIILKL